MKSIEKEANDIDHLKGQTLQEISEIVVEMTTKLRKERENLEPMVSLNLQDSIKFLRSCSICMHLDIDKGT
jgi:hypothetical protein